MSIKNDTEALSGVPTPSGTQQSLYLDSSTGLWSSKVAAGTSYPIGVFSTTTTANYVVPAVGSSGTIAVTTTAGFAVPQYIQIASAGGTPYLGLATASTTTSLTATTLQVGSSSTINFPATVAFGGPASSGGTVTSVTASSPLASSGGATPNITITSPLPVANGGTGTASPSIVAGTNITVTGTWPNQTVNATASGSVTAVTASSPLSSSGGTTPNITITSPLPIANGGTGTASPGEVAGTGITLTGSFPTKTIALTTPVAVANGGTGTATPALVAGTNVTITGSWPNQTVNASGGGGGASAPPFSVVQEEIFLSTGTSSTSSTLTFPLTATSGNYLLVIVGYFGTGTITTPSGYTQRINLVSGGTTGAAIYVADKTSAGTETSVIIASSNAQNLVVRFLEITGPSRAMDQSATATGITTVQGSFAFPSISPTASSNLFVAGAFSANNNLFAFSGVNGQNWRDLSIGCTQFNRALVAGIFQGNGNPFPGKASAWLCGNDTSGVALATFNIK